jgi:hypothetical protein
MNKKQLAEMVKHLRKKKIEEIIGKPGKFDPEHTESHPSDPGSPNQYLHRMKTEARVPIFTGGAQGKSSLGNLKSRFANQRGRGRQNQKGRFLNRMEEEDNVELGSTDTGKKGKEAETINVNPKDNTASVKGIMSKNPFKETKEK